MPDKLRILIAEDHSTVREGLKLIVNEQNDLKTIAEATNGREAVSLSRELLPDIVLMDISMPELNGLKATAQLKRILPEIKILILTRHSDDAYLHELLEAGASGYILKQSTATEVVRAIRAVASGDRFLDPAMTDKVFRTLTDKPNKLRGEIRGEKLTIREEDILRYISLGYSNKEIAEKMDISIKTVEAHKANALRKLNIQSRKQIISFAIFKGWLDEN